MPAAAAFPRRSTALMARRSAAKIKHVAADRPAPPPSARPRTQTVNVSHPRLPGLTERVPRVIDGIEQMARQKLFGRDPVKAKRRAEAARIFRAAWDVLQGSVGGAMDFDRVRGAGLPGSPPVQASLNAGERMREARTKLYAEHYRVLAHILGQGSTITDVARMVHGTIVTKARFEEIGFMLREGLDQLANLWLGREQGSMPITGWCPPASVPQASDAATEIVAGSTAHATRSMVQIRDRKP